LSPDKQKHAGFLANSVGPTYHAPICAHVEDHATETMFKGALHHQKQPILTKCLGNYKSIFKIVFFSLVAIVWL
jgi:hypothetical protein